MELLFYGFAIIYGGSIGAVLFSYVKMRERANRNLPCDKQLPWYVADFWGFSRPISTFYGVAEEYGRQFPDSPLPKICGRSFVVALVAFAGIFVTSFWQPTP
jgi:hypothetical protein